MAVYVQQDIVIKMLHVDPHQRLTAPQVLLVFNMTQQSLPTLKLHCVLGLVTEMVFDVMLFRFFVIPGLWRETSSLTRPLLDKILSPSRSDHFTKGKYMNLVNRDTDSVYPCSVQKILPKPFKLKFLLLICRCLRKF